MTIFGLIGHPLAHSYSSEYFSRKFTSRPQYEYRNFDLDNISELQALLVQNKNIAGLNVTIPYKKTVLSILDEISPQAVEIEAVNCISILREKEEIHLKGYNTDVPGFLNSLNNISLSDHHGALILGTGGAASAVAYAFKQLEIPYLKVSRTPSEIAEIPYMDITPELISEFSFIVNTTPAGMYPNVDNMPEFPVKYFSKKNFVYDLIYNPQATLLLKAASESGAHIKNGMEMLHLQAEASWEIWKTDHQISEDFT